jgi:type IV pilus assembly protein PilO
MAQSSLAKLPPAGKVGLGALICILIGTAFYFLVYDDLTKKVVATAKKTTDLEAEEKLQKAAQTAYFQDKNELALREAKQKDMNRMLPLEAESGSFLSTIQATSNVAGIDLKGYTPQDEQTQVFFARVPMKLEITGRFHQLAKFMYELGRTERIINVENIEFTDPALTGDEVNLKAKCLATTFHLVKQVAPVVPVPPPGAPAPVAPPQGAK